MLADRVRERELPLLGELRDRRLREDLVDRAEVELRVRPVRDVRGPGPRDRRPRGRTAFRSLAMRTTPENSPAAASFREVRVGRGGGLRVRALPALLRRARIRRLLEAQAPDSVGLRGFEPDRDLEPVASRLRAGQEDDFLGRPAGPRCGTRAGPSRRPCPGGARRAARPASRFRAPAAKLPATNAFIASGVPASKACEERPDPPARGSVGRAGVAAPQRATPGRETARGRTRSEASCPFLRAPPSRGYAGCATPSSSPGCPRSASSGSDPTSSTAPCDSSRPRPSCPPWRRGPRRGCRSSSRSSGSP